MKRRTFLQMAAALAAAPKLAIAYDEPKIGRVDNFGYYGNDDSGNVRVLEAYDLAWDRKWKRYDIFDGKIQLGIDIQYSDEMELPELQEIALQRLRDDAKREGMDINNLVKLINPDSLECEYISLNKSKG